ncbi:MAG: LysR family transcriptional regulator [Gammaproteobacteria bacterium]|nr:LysR family transcriptional regulator [Gammaproteobacteria bacterium]
MDRLTAMRTFVEVAKTASFTQAAEHLAMSRLQVSRHVQEIESWLQQRLLHRTTRKVSLTSVGEDVLKQCEQILHQAGELESQALLQSQQLTGNIRIASPIGLAQGLLLDVIAGFTQDHPQVKIDILASDSLSQLVDERIDIALRYTNEPDESLIARKLLALDSVICASPAYLKQHGEPNSPQELAQHNCFIHQQYKQWRFVKDNQHYPVQVSGNVSANELGTLSRLAVRGNGIVLLPCDLANPLIEAGKLTPILSAYTLPSTNLWAVYLSRSYQLPVVRQFINYIANSWNKDIVRIP